MRSKIYDTAIPLILFLLFIVYISTEMRKNEVHTRLWQQYLNSSVLSTEYVYPEYEGEVSAESVYPLLYCGFRVFKKVDKETRHRISTWLYVHSTEFVFLRDYSLTGLGSPYPVSEIRGEVVSFRDIRTIPLERCDEYSMDRIIESNVRGFK